MAENTLGSEEILPPDAASEGLDVPAEDLDPEPISEPGGETGEAGDPAETAAEPISESETASGYVPVDRIIPTVGRVVYFYEEVRNPVEEEPNVVVPRAAIITGVGDPALSVVDLAIFEPGSLIFEQNVLICEDDVPTPGRWDWMPFQKGLKRAV